MISTTICKKGDNPAQYICSICGEPVCVDDSLLVVICKDHYTLFTENKNIHVRYATQKDEDAMEGIEDTTIWEHIKPTNYKSSGPEEGWKYIPVNALVAEVDKKVVGFVEFSKGIDPFEKPAITISDFGVLPEYQSIGVGSKIINELKNIANKEGFGRIYTTTTIDNIMSIVFHLKNGAKIFAFEDNENTGKGRWGIPTNYDLSLYYEVE